MYCVFLTIKTNEQEGREIIKNEFIRNTRDWVTHKNKDSMLTVLKSGEIQCQPDMSCVALCLRMVGGLP